MAPPRRRPTPPPSPFAEVIARLDAVAHGEPSHDCVATGFPSVDRVLGGGLRRQDLVVLAGDVGSGKSALALAIALRAARLGAPTLLLSGEMGEGRVRERAVALEGKTAIDDLRAARLDDATRARVAHAALELREVPVAIAPLVGDTFEELDSAPDRLPRPRLLVVDSLQLVTPPRAALRSDDRLALAAAALKALAIRRDVAVLVTAHLPRFRAGRPDPRPVLDDLGGRGGPKQHADVVLGLYREEMYRPHAAVTGATELIILKNRNGTTGFVDLYFHKRWLRFEDMLD